MKKNPFKVEDRVRVYSGMISSVLPIHKIHGEFVELKCAPIKYHWKQCRRLRPKVKKNPFKAGDRVITYRLGDRLGPFTVLASTEDHVDILGIGIMPYKRFRKLKPKVKKEEPPKEVWVSIVEGVVGSVYLPDRPIPQGAIKYIRADE